MIQIKKEKGIKVPLTLPLAADSSFEVLVDRYYEMIDLDFWSVQVYDIGRLEAIISFLIACQFYLLPQIFDKMHISFYRNRTAKNPKPLLITEFGVDAMGSRTYESYEFQATPQVSLSL